MKFLNRFMLGSLVLALALSLCAGTADAASKKSKKSTKKEAKKEVKKEKKREARREAASEKHFVTGTNTMGRAGLFYGDTSSVAETGKWEGSLHVTYWSPGYDSFSVPLGAHLGIAENFELSGALVLNSVSYPSITFLGTTIGGGSSTTLGIDLGGKYRIVGKASGMAFSLGGDVYMEDGHTVATPRGTLTFETTSGLLLNGDVGIHISDPTTWVSFDAGVGVPFSNKFAGIVEIGANQLGDSGSVLGGGIRAGLGDNAKVQALLGIPLNGGGVQIGAGIILGSN